jgi:hypothetical protein
MCPPRSGHTSEIDLYPELQPSADENVGRTEPGIWVSGIERQDIAAVEDVEDVEARQQPGSGDLKAPREPDVEVGSAFGILRPRFDEIDGDVAVDSTPPQAGFTSQIFLSEFTAPGTPARSGLYDRVGDLSSQTGA